MTETLTAPAAPEPTPSSGGGKKVAVGAGAVGLLAVVGGGAFAWTQLSGGGAQPHDVLPDDTIAYVRVDADPSAGQKIEFFRLLREVPELGDFLKDELGLDDAEDLDLRKVIVEEAFSDCDLTYDEDVAPWIGDRFGAGLRVVDDEPVPIITVQVKNEADAEDGIAKLFGCGDEEYGIDFLDGYAILAPTQDDVDDAVEAATEKSLADDETFAGDFDALGDQGILSAWGSFRGLDPYVDNIDPENIFGLQDALAEVDSFAIALRAQNRTIELAGVGRSATDLTEPKGAGLGHLPDDTLLGFSAAGVGDEVSANWDMFVESFETATDLTGGGSSTFPDEFYEGLSDEERADFEQYFSEQESFGPSVDDVLETLERDFGFVLPDDIETLFGDSLTFYVGPDGIAGLPELEGPEDLSTLAAGFRMSSDPSKAGDLAAKIVDAIEQVAGFTLVSGATDDGAVIATNTDVVERLGQDGKLRNTDEFKSAIAGDGNLGGLFVNVAGIIAEIREADPPADVEDFLDDLAILRAVGASADRIDDRLAEFALRFAFAKSD